MVISNHSFFSAGYWHGTSLHLFYLFIYLFLLH